MFTEKDVELSKKIEADFYELIGGGKLDHYDPVLVKIIACHTLYLAKLENEINKLKLKMEAYGL